MKIGIHAFQISKEWSLSYEFFPSFLFELLIRSFFKIIWLHHRLPRFHHVNDESHHSSVTDALNISWWILHVPDGGDSYILSYKQIYLQSHNRPLQPHSYRIWISNTNFKHNYYQSATQGHTCIRWHEGNFEISIIAQYAKLLLKLLLGLS